MARDYLRSVFENTYTKYKYNFELMNFRFYKYVEKIAYIYTTT